MSPDEYRRRLRDMTYTAGMNIRYHQKLAYWFGIADRLIRITVAVLAFLAAILAVPALDCPWTAFGFAVAAGVLALILNVVPVVEKMQFHGEMFRAWSDVKRDALQEEHKTCDENPVDHHHERLAELTGKVETLNAMEPEALRWVLVSCQQDENEAEWGEGIRTTAQVEAERSRRKTQYTTSPSASAASAADQE